MVSAVMPRIRPNISVSYAAIALPVDFSLRRSLDNLKASSLADVSAVIGLDGTYEFQGLASVLTNSYGYHPGKCGRRFSICDGPKVLKAMTHWTSVQLSLFTTLIVPLSCVMVCVEPLPAPE